MTGLHPGTVTVILATRWLPVVFVVTVTTMVAFPDPEDGATVHQVWLLAIVHEQEVVNVKLVVPAEAFTVRTEGFTVKVQGACVTVTNTGLRPATDTVMVATLVAQVVLAV